MRYFIELAYNGTNYHGWQRQPNAKSIQQEIINCLSTLLKTPIELIGAGRTDSGVHAKHMVAHFDCSFPFETDTLLFKMSSCLVCDIKIKRIY